MSGEEFFDDAAGEASANEAEEAQEDDEAAEGSPEGSPDPSDVEDLLEDSSGLPLTHPPVLLSPIMPTARLDINSPNKRPYMHCYMHWAHVV